MAGEVRTRRLEYRFKHCGICHQFISPSDKIGHDTTIDHTPCCECAKVLNDVDWAEYEIGWEANSWKRACPPGKYASMGYSDRYETLHFAPIPNDTTQRFECFKYWKKENPHRKREERPWWKCWADCFRVMLR